MNKRQWVVFTREPDVPDIDRVWIFVHEGPAAAWLEGQLRLGRRATMVSAHVVNQGIGSKECGEGSGMDNTHSITSEKEANHDL